MTAATKAERLVGAKGRVEVLTSARRWLLERVSVLLFIAAWELLPRAGGLLETFIAPPSVVATVLWETLSTGELVEHVQVSLLRALTGFAIATVVALPLGFLLGGGARGFERASGPLLAFLAQVNPFTLVPIFVLFFGIGELSKSVMVFWVCLWPLIIHTVTGVKEVDPLLVRAARTMGCGPARMFFKVILPAAAPGIFAGLRSAAATSFFILVAAEMIGASAGLGWLVWNAQVNFQMPRLFAATVAIALLGLGLNALLELVERRLLGWKVAWNTH